MTRVAETVDFVTSRDDAARSRFQIVTRAGGMTRWCRQGRGASELGGKAAPQEDDRNGTSEFSGFT